MNQKFHYFMIGGMQFLVLGFLLQEGSVVCADLLGFTEDEAEALIDFALSDKGQSTPYLLDALALWDSDSVDWLKLNRFRVSLDEIEGYIPAAQLEAFRAEYNAEPINQIETTEDILYGRIK